MMTKLSKAALLALWIAPAAAHGGEFSSRDVPALVDRVTWGRTYETVTEVERLGPSRWLTGQLKASAPEMLPPQVQAEIDAMKISRTPIGFLAAEMDAQATAADAAPLPIREAAKAEYHLAMADLRQQTAARHLLRALYSKNQLLEQMTWFWMNHFNVRADKRDIRAMIADYEDQAIRPHALGKFRDLLQAADEHPAMLRYLDNDMNSAGHINENYAREILELHTMGVGSGYTQEDIENFARILTGVGVRINQAQPNLSTTQRALYVRRGLMEFNPARHDFGEKTLLGRKFSGSGVNEFEGALDMLSRLPETAKYISRKLCLYFMDSAPPALIERMSATFLKSDGDIADTLATMFISPEFRSSLGKKLKDPIHYTISAIRLAYDGQVIGDTIPIRTWINRMGQNLYSCETPDGYPLEQSAWAAPSQLTTMFEVAGEIGSGKPELFKVPQSVMLSPPQLRNKLFETRTNSEVSKKTKLVLRQAKSSKEWNVLFLSSPEFLHR